MKTVLHFFPSNQKPLRIDYLGFFFFFKSHDTSFTSLYGALHHSIATTLNIWNICHGDGLQFDKTKTKQNMHWLWFDVFPAVAFAKVAACSAAATRLASPVEQKEKLLREINEALCLFSPSFWVTVSASREGFWRVAFTVTSNFHHSCSRLPFFSWRFFSIARPPQLLKRSVDASAFSSRPIFFFPHCFILNSLVSSLCAWTNWSCTDSLFLLFFFFLLR